jgi:transposase
MKLTPLASLPIGEDGVLKDERVMASSEQALVDYPEDLRLVTYYDAEKKKTLEFITNNFDISAKDIADSYKARWDIELFFKRIRQNLKIKTFFGTSENAVMVQVWIAMIYYLLIMYIKKQMKIVGSPLKLTRMIAETLMDRVHLIDIVSLNVKKLARARDDPQLALF